MDLNEIEIKVLASCWEASLVTGGHGTGWISDIKKVPGVTSAQSVESRTRFKSLGIYSSTQIKKNWFFTLAPEVQEILGVKFNEVPQAEPDHWDLENLDNPTSFEYRGTPFNFDLTEKEMDVIVAIASCSPYASNDGRKFTDSAMSDQWNWTSVRELSLKLNRPMPSIKGLVGSISRKVGLSFELAPDESEKILCLVEEGLLLGIRLILSRLTPIA